MPSPEFSSLKMIFESIENRCHEYLDLEGNSKISRGHFSSHKLYTCPKVNYQSNFPGVFDQIANPFLLLASLLSLTAQLPAYT